MKAFREHLVHGFLALAGWALVAVASAQPNPGSTYREHLPMGSGASVPLPEGTWRVTHVSALPMGSGVNAWDAYALKNEQPNAKVLFLVVRQTRQADRWGNTGCQSRNPNQFMVNEHGTRSNDLINKCSRVFAIGNVLSWKNVPEWIPTTPKSDRDWWQDISNGLQDMGVNGPRALLLVEMHVQQYNNKALRVEAFVQAPRGFSPGRFRDDFRAGTVRAEHDLLSSWNAIYVEAMQQSYFSRKPQSVLALGYETGPVKTPTAVSAAGASPALDANAQVRELDEASRQAASERLAQSDKAPAAPSVPVAAALPTPAPLPAAVAAAQDLAAERARLEQERKAAEEEKRKLAQQLETMAKTLARLQQENAAAAKAQAAPAAAAPAPANEPAKPVAVMAYRKALVIGNDLYTDVPKLNNAVADAEAMAKSLEAVGYKVFKHLNVSEKKFRQVIREFKQQVSGGDEVLVFYAGHGVQLGNANYLLPVDIRGDGEDQVRDEAVLLQKILDDLEEKKTKFSLAVIDACRDNPFKGKGRAIGGRGLAPTTAATGQMIMFSAGSGQQALDRLGDQDKERNGLFTRIFVKEMQKPGLSVDRVLRNVRNEVVRLARSVGHEQTPALYDQSIGEFYFRN